MPDIVRDDVSNLLVHLTRGHALDPAVDRANARGRFNQIVGERVLRGSDGYIRGQYRCVCFTETPVSKLSQVIASTRGNDFKYAPYGVMVTKRWLFERGGRHVIYGPYGEFDQLPEEFRYRHVRFHLAERYTVDYSWEREWRILTDELHFRPADVTLIVPDRAAKEQFERTYPGTWHYIVLSDLGMQIDGA